jgi:membrane fusion protein, multidrug efflux system
MLRQIVISIVLVVLFYLPNVAFAAKPKNQVPPVFVETITVKTVSKPDQITSTGNLISIPGIIVKPEISGRITKVYFKSGDVVEKGVLLVEINPDIIKADLVSAQAELNVTKLNFERSSSLYKTNDVSKSDFDRAQANYNSAKAKVDGMQAKLQQATLKAPFSGKLGLSQVNEGDYVNVGQNIVNLQTVDPLKVDFSIPELYQSKVAVGQMVLLNTDAYPQETFNGTVEAIEVLINQNNRTLGVRANVPNGSGKLISGGFVTVVLRFAERQLITIPQTSVVYAADGSYVFKVVGDQAEKTKVVLGEKDSDNVEIKSGLNVGDVVVTAGQIKIMRPGTHVIVTGNKK